MPKVVREMEIKDARIEEIVAFKSMDNLETYVQRQKSKVLYDVNFGFGMDISKPQWCEAYTSTAVRYAKDGELLIHICFPYNSIRLDKEGLLCAGL